MKSKNAIPIIAVLLAGIVVAFLTLRIDKNSVGKDSQENQGTEKKDADVAKGPHGGRLLSKDGFQVEVTIYEKGVPPQFRIHSFEKGKPIDPNEVKLNIALHRLGGRVDEIRFQKEGDYLRGDKVIEEPHSFDVKVVAERKGQTYQWEYSQVEGRVEMSPKTAESAGIEVKTAGPVRIKTVLELPGEIGFNKNKVAHVVPMLSGVVTEVRKNLGDKVKKGEVLAVLNSRELSDLKSAYLSSTKRVELAKANFEREERLFKKKISPEQDFLTSKQVLAETEIELQAAIQRLFALGLSKADIKNISETAEGNLARYKLLAPFDGMVVEKHVAVGEAIKEDADIFVIADLSTLWGEITVYAKDLLVVRLGQKVTVRSKGLDLETTGKVSYLGSLVGEQTRAATAYVDIPNPKGIWRPGLFVTVELVQEEVTVPVAVSSDAIQTFREWNVVFVQYGNQFEVRPLELGRSDGKWVEVVSGLSAGEKYAEKNSFVLKADLGKAGASHDH